MLTEGASGYIEVIQVDSRANDTNIQDPFSARLDVASGRWRNQAVDAFQCALIGAEASRVQRSKAKLRVYPPLNANVLMLRHESIKLYRQAVVRQLPSLFADAHEVRVLNV